MAGAQAGPTHGGRIGRGRTVRGRTGPVRFGRGRTGVVIAGVTALVLLVVAVGVGWTLGRTVWTPERPVTEFLTALEHGQVQRALALADVRPTTADVLLTRGAYAAATDRVTEHRVLDATVTGDTATVRVRVDQHGSSSTSTFTLVRTGFAVASLGQWRLVPIALGQVRVDVRGPADAGVDVAGVHVAPGGRVVSLRALPGRYAVTMASTTEFTGGRMSSMVQGFGSGAVSGAQLSAQLTPAGTQAATRAVDAWIDRCVAATTMHPAGCSFSAYVQDDADTYSNEHWTLDRRPTFTVGDWTGTGWQVSTTSRGAVTFRATFTSPTGRGTGTAGPIQFSADGLITGFTDGTASFTPLTGGGGGRSGTTTI